MATKVFANGNEICCKASKGKTSVAFPDCCWSPPPPPTGPIILPYPNLAKPSSLKKGSKTVLIKGTQVALADRSYFSKSTGNEPATQGFQKGVLTRKLTGKAYFKRWSQNVKVEGKGVCRHLDLMSHNHGSQSGNTLPFPFMSTADISPGGPCEKAAQAVADNCGPGDTATDQEKNDWKWNKHCPDILNSPNLPFKDKSGIPITDGNNKRIKVNSDEGANLFLKQLFKEEDPTLLIEIINNKFKIDYPPNKKINHEMLAELQTKAAAGDSESAACLQARKCVLVTYSDSQNGKECCGQQTGHHLIPHSAMTVHPDDMNREQYSDYMKNKDRREKHPSNCEGYHLNKAPTVCAEGINQNEGSHKELHHSFARRLNDYMSSNKVNDKFPHQIPMQEAIKCAAASHKECGYSCDNDDNTPPESGCIATQLKNYYAEKCQCGEMDIYTVDELGQKIKKVVKKKGVQSSSNLI